jgi:hypothetical protein
MKMTGSRGFKAVATYALAIAVVALPPGAAQAQHVDESLATASQLEPTSLPSVRLAGSVDRSAVRIRDWRLTPADQPSSTPAALQGPIGPSPRLPRPHQRGGSARYKNANRVLGGVAMGILGFFVGGAAGAGIGAASGVEEGALPGLAIGAPVGAIAGAVLGVAVVH